MVSRWTVSIHNRISYSQLYCGHCVLRGYKKKKKKKNLYCPVKVKVENAKNPPIFSENPLALEANDEESDPEINPGADTWVSNLTKEVLSWTHKREMVSSSVIKQGQWRAIYFWNRMESVTGLLMGSWLRAGGGEDPRLQD